VQALLSEYGRTTQAPVDEPPPARAPFWQSLLTRIPVRWDPGRSGAFAVGLAVIAAAVVTGLWLLGQRPHAVPVAASDGRLSSAPPPMSTGAVPSDGVQPAPPAAAATGTLLVVDVAGKVRRPGLYRLPDGSRVDDAIQAAGGALRGVDLTSLNLAARVVDGQQILVGVRASAVPAMPGTGGGATSGSAAPVSLNTATLEQLETLPGIGPVLAQNILDWRTANGGFDTIDQLTEVSGIGDITFAELRPLVTL
jgi:competence protein ComEA